MSCNLVTHNYLTACMRMNANEIRLNCSFIFDILFSYLISVCTS